MTPESLAGQILAAALTIIALCVVWTSGYAAGMRESGKIMEGDK